MVWPFPLTGEATSSVDLTGTLAVGLEIPWEVRGSANQKRPSPLEGAGWEGHRQGGPRLLERILPRVEALTRVKLKRLASEAGGPGQAGWEPLYPQPRDRIWAEQGPVNTCDGLEAFPRDGTLPGPGFSPTLAGKPWLHALSLARILLPPGLTSGGRSILFQGSGGLSQTTSHVGNR